MNCICPKTETCAHKFCPHSQVHEHKAFTCAGNGCGCPGCIVVGQDQRRVVYPLAVLLLFLLGVGMVSHLQKPPLQNAIVPCDSVAQADQQVVSIIKLLDGESQPNGLQQAWPTAALDMQEIGRMYRVNPIILAVLCRAEGGLRNPTAIRKRNAFGLSRSDTMIALPSFRAGAERAAKIVSLAMGEGEPNYIYPDADYWGRLAATYCPKNAERWAATCRQIWAER